MSDLIEREYLLNIARKEEAYGYVSEHEILNAPNAETTGALDDAIQEYIKDGYILVEPNAWRLIKTTPMTVEERAEYSERLGHDLEDDEAVMYFNLPEDGERVLVSTDYGEVTLDTFIQDDMGCYFEENMDMEGIVAWMPLPKPYEMERSEGTDDERAIEDLQYFTMYEPTYNPEDGSL